MHKEGKILGVKVNFIPKSVVLDKIDSYLSGDYGSVVDSNSKFPLCPKSDLDYNDDSSAVLPIICTTNPEFIISAQCDEEFLKIINSSFLSVPDGIGVIYAQKYLEILDSLKSFFSRKSCSRGFLSSKDENDKPLKGTTMERVSGADLIYDICYLASEKGYSVFLLGGWPTNFWGKPIKNAQFDLADEASKVLLQMFPKLKIVGATSQFSYLPKDDSATIKFIQEKMSYKGIKAIDILFVCYGQNNQEKWIHRNWSKIPARLSLGLGGTFDYVSGHKHRSPRLFVRFHIEWLYRLITQPWRIKRIAKSCFLFPYLVITKSAKCKI